MSDHPHNFEPADEALLTAFALGELEGADAAAAERLLAADPAAHAVVEDVRRTASWLTESFTAEPDVGLTAIHVASIERQLARLAEVDAPVPEPIPLRRNWGLWGSVAASMMIVATVMASILPQVFRDKFGSGGGGNPGTPGANPAPEATTTPGNGTGGLVITVSPGTPGPKSPATGDVGDASDWPILKTSAGGLPWPAIISRQTGFYEPAFVVPSDFPVAIIPPTPTAAQLAGKGTLSTIQSSLSANRLPSPKDIRADELVNGLHYDGPPQQAGEPVSATIETAVCPWNSGHLLVRVAVRANDKVSKPTEDDDAPPAIAPGILPLVRDLRLMVEVNPAAAAGYRVIGYENGPRSWGEWAGRDDHEVIAPGTMFTALLEVVPTGQVLPESSKPAEPRKYLKRQPIVVTTTELLTVSVEYRQGPDSQPAKLELPVSVEAMAIELASVDFRAAAGAAALGLSLRHADPAADPLLETSIKLLADVTATAPAADREALLELARKVKSIGESDQK